MKGAASATPVLDFERDWRAIVAAKLVEMGYDASPDEPTDQLGIAYFNALRRRIEARPRVMHRADTFSCPPEHAEGFAALRGAVERGDDLTRFLSRRMRQRGYDDGLLNDWGIFHFHLGTRVEADGFVARTPYVLFAVVRSEDFYMLACRLHGRGATEDPWSQQELLNIVHRNWPELIAQWRVPAEIVDVQPVLTDADVAAFRGAGITALFKMADGAIYFPPGGGIATDRTSAAVVDQLHCVIATLRLLEREVRENIDVLARTAERDGFQLGPEIRLRLTCDAKDRLGVIDEGSGFRSRFVFNEPVSICDK
jgi:hypothetical protein